MDWRIPPFEAEIPFTEDIIPLVETYDDDPSPATVEVYKGVEFVIGPVTSNPLVVEKSCAADTYPKDPRPAIVEMSRLVET